MIFHLSSRLSDYEATKKMTLIVTGRYTFEWRTADAELAPVAFGSEDAAVG
jgi:hypothetical protein